MENAPVYNSKRKFKGKYHYCMKKYSSYRQKNCTEHIEADGKSKPGGYSETERGKNKGSKVRLLTHHVLEVKSPQITGL